MIIYVLCCCNRVLDFSFFNGFWEKHFALGDRLGSELRFRLVQVSELQWLLRLFFFVWFYL